VVEEEEAEEVEAEVDLAAEVMTDVVEEGLPAVVPLIPTQEDEEDAIVARREDQAPLKVLDLDLVQIEAKIRIEKRAKKTRKEVIKKTRRNQLARRKVIKMEDTQDMLKNQNRNPSPSLNQEKNLDLNPDRNPRIKISSIKLEDLGWCTFVELICIPILVPIMRRFDSLYLV